MTENTEHSANLNENSKNKEETSNLNLDIENLTFEQVVLELYPSCEIPDLKKEINAYISDLVLPPLQDNEEEDIELGSSESKYILNINPCSAKTFISQKFEEEYCSLEEIFSLSALRDEIYVIDKILSNMEVNGDTDDNLQDKYDKLSKKYETLLEAVKEKKKTAKDYREDIEKELILEQKKLQKIIEVEKKNKKRLFYTDRIRKRIKNIEDEIDQLKQVEEQTTEIKKSKEYKLQNTFFMYLKQTSSLFSFLSQYYEQNSIQPNVFLQKRDKVDSIISSYVLSDNKARNNFSYFKKKVPKYDLPGDITKYTNKNLINKYTSILSKLEQEFVLLSKSPVKDDLNNKKILLLKKLHSYISDFYETEEALYTPPISYTTIKQDAVTTKVENPTVEDGQLIVTLSSIKVEKSLKGKSFIIQFLIEPAIWDNFKYDPKKENFEEFCRNYTLDLESTFCYENKEMEFCLFMPANGCCAPKKYRVKVSGNNFKTKSTFRTVLPFGGSSKNILQMEAEFKIRTPLNKATKIVQYDALVFEKIYSKFPFSNLPQVDQLNNIDFNLDDEDEEGDEEEEDYNEKLFDREEEKEDSDKVYDAETIASHPKSSKSKNNKPGIKIQNKEIGQNNTEQEDSIYSNSEILGQKQKILQMEKEEMQIKKQRKVVNKSLKENTTSKNEGEDFKNIKKIKHIENDVKKFNTLEYINFISTLRIFKEKSDKSNKDLINKIDKKIEERENFRDENEDDYYEDMNNQIHRYQELISYFKEIKNFTEQNLVNQYYLSLREEFADYNSE